RGAFQIESGGPGGHHAIRRQRALQHPQAPPGTYGFHGGPQWLAGYRASQVKGEAGQAQVGAVHGVLHYRRQQAGRGTSMQKIGAPGPQRRLIRVIKVAIATKQSKGHVVVLFFATGYCSRRVRPFMARMRVLISSMDSSVASRWGILNLLYKACRARTSISHWRGDA